MLPKEQIETIVFDIDGTIAPGVSWLRMTEQLGASVAEHERIYRDMIAGITDLNEAKSELVALWGATGNARKDLFREMFDLFPLDDGVDSMIASLWDRYRICLISGSMDHYVESVARRLGVSHWYANSELIFWSNGNLIDFTYYPDQSAKKLEQLEQYLHETGIAAESCLVVWNGENDLALFEKAAWGIAIDRDLHDEIARLATIIVPEVREIERYL